MSNTNRDVLRYPGETPEFRAAPEGDGRHIVAAHEDEMRKRRRVASVGGLVLALLLAAALALYVPPVFAIIAAGAVFAVAVFLRDEPPLPELVDESIPLARARRQYDAVDYAADSETGTSDNV